MAMAELIFVEIGKMCKENDDESVLGSCVWVMLSADVLSNDQSCHKLGEDFSSNKSFIELHMV